MSDDEGSESGDPRYQVIFDGDEKPDRYLRKDGKATATFPNGDTYTGEYAGGKRHGRGTYKFANGALYEGEYANGLKEGQGMMRALDGSTYTGQWKADKREGTGTYKYASGDSYTGSWKGGVKHGKGVYHYASDGSSIAGEWSNGQLMHGCWSMADGTRFFGKWHGGMPSGPGNYFFASGNSESGRYGLDRKKGYNWSRIKPKLHLPTDEVSPVESVDVLKVAQRFLAKSILKADQFEDIDRLNKEVKGCPNFRKVAEQNIFGVGQPTSTGLSNFVEHVGESFGVDKLVWINLRTEPIVYVNDSSYIPRAAHALHTPMNVLSSSKETLTGEQLASLESFLATKLIHDISHRGNLHTFLKDTFADVVEDRKHLELSEEVRPDEEGSYTTAIRAPTTVWETLAEEGGADIEYKRIPFPSGVWPDAKVIDELISIIKQTDSNTGLAFNDQSGRARATIGTILATLMRRTAEALATNMDNDGGDAGMDDEGEQRQSNKPSGKTDIDGVDIPEYDDSDPNYKLGQYGLIMKLVKALPAGEQIKAEVDDAIDRCKQMHSVREFISYAREQHDREVASNNGSSSDRSRFWLDEAKLAVERYAYLILFQAYVKANIETEYEQQTFEQFIQANQQLIQETIGSREEGPIKEFKWQ